MGKKMITPAEAPATPMEAIMHACGAASTPCAVFSAPAIAPVFHNSSFREWGGLDADHPEDWPDCPRIMDAIQHAAQTGLPGEVTISEGRDMPTFRVLCTPAMGPKGVHVVALWFSGPAFADKEVLEKAQRAIAAKSHFLAAASHDLRQPFQAMRLFHSLLAQQVREPTAQRSIELLGSALDSGEQLLNSLLDISRLDAGVTVPVRTSCDLEPMLMSIVEEFRPRADAKGLRFRARISTLIVNTDPVLLGRVVRNIVDNATAYTLRGGILLGVRRRGGIARIEVWDTGFGIPPDKIGDIFEDFFQLENPERDRTRGTGLGLAIVRRVSNLLNAPVEVRSELGRGSVFSVSVPLSQDVAQRGNLPAAENIRLGCGQKILVVDDDLLVLAGLQAVLESWDYTVLSAETMAGALAVIDQAVPDLILSDLRLRGGLTGFEVIDRVRTLMRRDIPAVLLTGDTGEGELAAAKKRGLPLLHKPIQADELQCTISRTLCRAASPSAP